ncbi:ABC transporter substrate-binding protein [Candidatus Phytoplasma meliae]|uniref:Solute-binding protein family 5 domain-containing protein n=1 Tax=Candidatus Phytoplasma meliae TaxID=1848402 RepID=A0ABS5CY33_9MOLU|nr:ABC transporter substrate-binding protein [Candidatus Phytoplasma meliae]MBP5835888.1 hypothetical protein [Candidatus Phytoplasma meliae]
MNKFKNFINKNKKILLISSLSLLLVLTIIAAGWCWWKVKQPTSSISEQNISERQRFKDNLEPVNQELLRIAYPEEIGSLNPLHPQTPPHVNVSKGHLHQSIYKLLTKSFFEEKQDANFLLLLPNLIVSVKDNDNQEYQIKTEADFHNAKNIQSPAFSFKIQDHATFEDKQPINTDVVEYTIEQYLKYYQNNYRNKDFKDRIKSLQHIGIEFPSCSEDNSVINLSQCFEKVSDLEFKIKYPEPKNLLEVMQKINNITLVPKLQFSQSLVGDEIRYGTKQYPFISYGDYKIASGYNPDKCIFVRVDGVNSGNTPVINKNKKPQTIEIITMTQEEQQELLQQHKLSFVIPLVPKEWNMLDKYLDNPGLESFSSNFISLFRIEDDENTDEQSLKKGDALLKDVCFRKALFYGLNRAQIADITKMSPSLSLVSDVAKVSENAPFYNGTQEHRDNVYEFLKEDGIIENDTNHNLDDNNLLISLKDKFLEKAKVLIKQSYEQFINKYYSESNEDSIVPLEIKLRYQSDAVEKEAVDKTIEILENLFSDALGVNKIKIKKIKVGLEPNATEEEVAALMMDPELFNPSNYSGYTNQDKDDPDTILYHFIPYNNQQTIKFNLPQFRQYLETHFGNLSNEQKPDWYPKLMTTGGELEILDLTSKQFSDLLKLDSTTTIQDATSQLNASIKKVHFNAISENGDWEGNATQLIGVLSTSLLKANISQQAKQDVCVEIIKVLEKNRYNQCYSIPLTTIKKFVVFDDVLRDKDNYLNFFHF